MYSKFYEKKYHFELKLLFVKLFMANKIFPFQFVSFAFTASKTFRF